MVKSKKKALLLDFAQQDCSLQSSRPSAGSCCDVAIAQINYPSLINNTQYSIEQARGRSHEEGSSQIFMLDNMQLGFFLKLSMLCYSKQNETINAKSKKTKIYQEKQTWSQVNIYLQKSELIMEMKRQFIL